MIQGDTIYDLEANTQQRARTQFLFEKNNKLYTSSTNSSYKGVYYLDLLTREFLVETVVGYNYNAPPQGLIEYEGKEYLFAPGYIYNFTDKVMVKFFTGGNTSTPFRLGQYHFLEGSVVSDFTTKQMKLLTDYYAVTPNVSGAIAIAKGEAGYILYGEVD